MTLEIKNYHDLKEKYRAVNIDKIIDNILKKYKDFEGEEKKIFIDSIKDFVFLKKTKKQIEEKKDDSFIKEAKEVRYEFIELISGKDKNWGEAIELMAQYVEEKLKIYTTKEDNNNEVWVYMDGVYKKNGRSEIKELLRKTLTNFYNSFVYNRVIEKIEPDTFIETKDFFSINKVDELPVRNGILNVITGELKPFDSDKIFFNKIPVKYDPNAKCPKIDEFLKNVLRDEEDRKVFFEIAGFSLLKDYMFEKAIMFFGDGRNGKGKTLELLKRFVGVENCCSVPLVSLDPNKFHISELFGKMLNLAGDIGNSDLKDTSMFKSLTGRDLINAHRKFKNDIAFKNYAKFIFACNELPVVYDTSFGFWSRWILLEFPYTFLNKEEYESAADKTNLKIKDERIIDKITSDEELSGLLNEALKGLKRLLKNKRFSSTKGTEETKKMWMRKSNSFISFCYDHIEGDINSRITKKQLRKRYAEYCKKHKISPKSDYVIKRTLQDSFGVIDAYVNLGIGQYDYVWEGIKWKN
ncbi:hypothetical protein DRN73_07460 [Candidatus Pacearchaeota archaeon]|nr:MAG: hypothetical protein DRN73_07460 [Candidatus Pacearchaeota archaeon]